MREMFKTKTKKIPRKKKKKKKKKAREKEGGICSQFPRMELLRSKHFKKEKRNKKKQVEKKQSHISKHMCSMCFPFGSGRDDMRGLTFHRNEGLFGCEWRSKRSRQKEKLL